MALESFDTSEISESFDQEVDKEIEQIQRKINENKVMIDQSQMEMNKLVSRNTAITSQLQQMESSIDTMAREEIKTTYRNAIEAQQRLLVMRGQVDKLQNEQNTLKQYLEFLEKTKLQLGENQTGGKSSGKSGSGIASLEMLISAQESERQRLSRQMHDGPAQALSNFIVQAEISARLMEIDPVRAKEELDNLKTSAMSTFQKVRTFITELRPMSLDDLGLAPTMKRYMETFKEQSGVDINFQMRGSERRLENYLEVMIYRAVQELMGNVVNHNQEQLSKIRIEVTVIIEEDYVRVTIGDNGVGFEPESVMKTGGLGLKLIRDRVEMLGGRMDIDSAPGKGSMITFQIPCTSTTPQPAQS